MSQGKFIPRALSAAALAMLFGTVPAHAQEQKAETSGSSTEASSPQQESSGASGASTSSSSSVSKGDRKIMNEIAQANLTEIETSKLALERSQDPQVKQFAQRMIDDHTKLQDELKQLAEAKNVQLPQEPSRQQQRIVERLSKAEGKKFDDEYRKQVAERAHEDTHKKLKQARKDAKDPQLSALVASALPVVEQHLSSAENMQTGTRASGSSGQSSGASGSDAGSSGADKGATDAVSGSAAPAGESGASMSSGTSGASDSGASSSGAESVSGTEGKSNAVSPGKQ
ncbi:MAG TPA: DUF4142 domain-containing protein [Noviherbaspirillum sp.]